MIRRGAMLALALAAGLGLGVALVRWAGVQEGSFVLVSGLFGVDPAAALVLSLVQHSRDLALGVPAWGCGRCWRCGGGAGRRGRRRGGGS